MKNKIVNNLFELWRLIGKSTGALSSTAGYDYILSDKNSWPSKVFELKHPNIDFKALHRSISNSALPNSISIVDNAELENQLFENNFILKSVVKGMYLNLREQDKPDNHFPTIEMVDGKETAIAFAQVASKSFGYEVLSATIMSLIDKPQIKLFVGRHNGTFSSCGLVLNDSNGISGLHMIGTIPECRGLGLGKIITNKLLLESYKNDSKQVTLVASKSGERIYAKLGFITEGSLKTYAV